MIKDFEKYHGVVLRDIIVCAAQPVEISATDEHGRINSYLIDGFVGLYIKHSSKRLPPWQFTFHEEHIDEVERLKNLAERVWIGLVCGPDGIAMITSEELSFMNDSEEEATWFVRVSRDRGTMYHLNGSADDLGSAKPRGVWSLVSQLKDAA